MIDTQAAGEIIEIKDKMVQVETGSLRFFVPLDKIERITRSDLKKSLRANQVYRKMILELFSVILISSLKSISVV